MSEIRRERSSSLLNNIFSTILNLASFQIRNSLPAAAQTAEFVNIPLDKYCYRKNLEFALRTPFSTFSETLIKEEPCGGRPLYLPIYLRGKYNEYSTSM
jgi:hypothetical protein